jgi:hypothetical protein
MSFIAVVENGAIKVPAGVDFPDGTRVVVAPAEEVTPMGGEPSLFESLSEFVGCIDSGLGDLADNHDHYLYGSPKRSK